MEGDLSRFLIAHDPQRQCACAGRQAERVREVFHAVRLDLFQRRIQSAYVRGMLQDAAGDREAALATLRGLQRPDVPSPLRQQAQKVLTRLGTVKP